jgi:hypothetical protein
MGDLSDSERGQIVAARLAGAFVKILHTLLGASRATVYKVASEYTKHEKGTSAKRNTWRNSTPTERDTSLYAETDFFGKSHNYCSTGGSRF